MKYWLTTHWPPLEDAEDGGPHGINLQAGQEDVGAEIKPGDHVFIYQSETGYTEIRTDKKGEEQRIKSKRGRGGIIAIEQVSEKLRIIKDAPPTRYVGRVSVTWKGRVDTTIVSEDGFIPRSDVNRVLGYEEGYSFRGYGTKHSGLAQLTSEQYKALSKLFHSRSSEGAIKHKNVTGYIKDDVNSVVYIHGIGRQIAPALLKREWDNLLFGTDKGELTRMAYWADIQHPFPSTEIKSIYGTFDLNFMEMDWYYEDYPHSDESNKYRDVLLEKLQKISDSNFNKIQDNYGTKIFPGFIRKPIFRLFAHQFVEDTAAYFFDEQKRDEMRARLKNLLMKGKSPYMIIAHSQGSIIAYDVLSELKNQDIRVNTFITIGSPLGISEIQDHISQPLRVPDSVENWYNFAHILDYVALDKTLREEFIPKDMIEDKTISFFETGFGINPHAVNNYLVDDNVRKEIREKLGSKFAEPLTSFVIAKDVVDEMSDPIGGRISVLIELSENNGGVNVKKWQQKLVDSIQSIIKNDNGANIEILKRYVAADLTAREIDELSSMHEEANINTIWKNSTKKALLYKSAHVVQSYTAQTGYKASGQGISWAVLDTGIKNIHPHFEQWNNIASEWDCTQIGREPQNGANDGNGHGTHVAGIISGGMNRGNLEVMGIAPKSKLHIYKVLSDNGSGRDSWIIKALDHIAEQNESSNDLRIHGINLSLGGSFNPEIYGCGFSPICREIRRLWRQGVVVCIAAGNEGLIVFNTPAGREIEMNLSLSIGDPANLEDAIAVGSVHKEFPHMHGPSYFSSRGPTADGRQKPDVVAPGEKILSCNSGLIINNMDSYYIEQSGTSMACPHISGVIAAFLSVRREFIGHPDIVKEIVLNNCTDLKRDSYHQGAGIPNLVKMLMNT